MISPFNPFFCTRTVAASWRDWILDGLFPPTCVGCEKDGVWLCQECFEMIELRPQASCPQCGHYPWSNHPCEGDWEFASFFSVGSYVDPLLQKLLRSYKYQRARCLEPVFATLLERFSGRIKETRPWPASNVIVTSLPMDADRLRARGLDHAALLADQVQRILLPQTVREQILRRTRTVVANATLSDPALRAANIKDVFACIKPVTIPVVLVDDVCTSGATAREAARTLLAQGVPEVHLFTFASGVKKPSSAYS